MDLGNNLVVCYEHFDHPLAIDMFWLDVYARKYDILNRGFSGYNTEWAIPVAEQV